MALTAPRRVAVLGGNRIPFARQFKEYAEASNQDMLTSALEGLVARYGLAGERLGEVVHVPVGDELVAAQIGESVLVDPEGSIEKRNHWEKTSHALLVGAILHVLYAEADKTLAGVAAFLSDPRRPIESTLAAMMTTAHLGKSGPHPVIASAARERSRRRCE